MKIAIVELSESHEECIYTQVSFLKKAKHSVTLIIHPKIKNQVLNYKDKLEQIITYDLDSIGGIDKLKLQIKIVNELKKFDKVIFNTASSSKSVRNILLFLKFFKVECIGVIHDVKKLEKSFTQKIISFKIKKYLTLSDHLNSTTNKSIKTESFYPIFFPKLMSSKMLKDENEIWVCIPGRVYYERRDYQFLIEKLKISKLNNNIKFIILGNINTKDGKNFKNQVNKYKLSNRFVFFDSFITNQEYYNYIDNSDYIMPLLQKEEISYLHYKITGTFNLAYAFKKQLLCDYFYSSIPDLKENSSFYNDSSFIDLLSSLSENNTLKKEIYKNIKWDYDFQYKKYINFIFKT